MASMTTRVIAIDPNPFKLDMAKRLGATRGFTSADEAHEQIIDLTRGQMAALFARAGQPGLSRPARRQEHPRRGRPRRLTRGGGTDTVWAPMVGDPDPIAAVIARLQSVETELPASDGVARFNYLYLKVTQSVDGAAESATFEEPGFIRALDVSFAGLYFAVLDASAAGRPLPRCWAPLFAARADPHIAPIQFALAGLNAHINHDLVLALVSTCTTTGLALATGSPQHRDFMKVDGLIAAVEAQVKADYLTGLVGVADEVLGRIDDVIANWSVTEARNAAWTHAQMLWQVRGNADLTAAFEDALDGTVLRRPRPAHPNTGLSLRPSH